MTIRVALTHKTEYHYDRLVGLSPQVIRLRPAPHCRTPIPSYSLKVEPGEHFLNWQQDPHGNFLARAVFPEKVRSFSVTVDLVAEMTVINPFDFFLEPQATSYPFEYSKEQERELKPYLERRRAGTKFHDYVASVPKMAERTIDFLVDLNRRVQKDVNYLIRMEPGVQAPEETLELGCGSCRDSAWLLVQVLRHLGLAARFCSGYLVQLAPDVRPLDGPGGPTQDFTDLHAWTEVFLPGAGWIGLDPTSGLLTGEGHIPLAATPEPQSAAPISGAVDESECEFHFEMEVRRIHEDPRVTKPYTEEQWARIEALGHEVDRQLRAGGVKLTMGGEPTFISIDDYDGAEWNTAALGTEKRLRAGQLIRRLRQRFAPNALLHFGQGKWYPGEQLPRWALTCLWRKDGEPVWTRDELIAEDDADYGHGAREAEQFGRALAERLGVNPEQLIAGYEDAFYYLWRERRLPTNVDPYDAKLSDEAERERLARVFERGLEQVVGYALPLGKGADGSGVEWQSGTWFLRSERMRLLPGDSPMGFRLPLDSLPYVHPDERQDFTAQDPMGARGRFPAYENLGARTSSLVEAGSSQPQFAVRGGRLSVLPGGRSDGWMAAPRPQALADRMPQRGESAPWLIRTALCVEPRGGVLHVFLPPVRTAVDYLELIATVEDAAAELSLPVRVEGYPAPFDPRLEQLKVTPDPGVIEVNVQPAATWDEQVRITEGLYEDARHCRLGTEKFEIDGRHSGTGGGNHIVLGGPSPAESPLLRRPDLLRSLVAYWHNHPSLSYVFGGLFIGPTSQAPRVDEARNDSIYELEIAFRELNRQQDGETPPWLVDRLFRHLLTDLTGNTHRAEFCIDKLFSPDSASGRLGLLELRAFEMPPHERMSLTQALLLRTLVARFWNTSYAPQRLARWGTDLHDRFLLPHFLEQDLHDVLEECRAAGYALEDQWFAPHLEFRFPVYGRIERQNIGLELRAAIEPWHVLGEEAVAGGTARYVDSSVERMQVKVRGLMDTRHALTCNGRVVPLHPTGVVGEAVAGIRYRAWQPPSCLHPTIGVHSPLVFDLVDRWMGRSIGGCQYHVSHPGGRNYETRPVNANEAEARRVARFFSIGHTPGMNPAPRPLPEPALSPEHPLTLDLRREPSAFGLS